MSTPELSRRRFLQVTAATLALASVSSLLLKPSVVFADEWVYAQETTPWQDPRWFPLKQAVADNKKMPTLYQPGGVLEYYDNNSLLVGGGTNFRGQVAQHATDYFNDYSFLDEVLKATTGYCHGGANASAYGEPNPPDLMALGLITALHSGDRMYKPGIESLMALLIERQRLFVVETQGFDGYWSRVAFAVNQERTAVLTSDFGRSPKQIPIDQIRNAYIPVPVWTEIPEGLGDVFDPQLLRPVPTEWIISLNPNLVRDLAYNSFPQR